MIFYFLSKVKLNLKMAMKKLQKMLIIYKKLSNDRL